MFLAPLMKFTICMLGNNRECNKSKPQAVAFHWLIALYNRYLEIQGHFQKTSQGMDLLNDTTLLYECNSDWEAFYMNVMQNM